MTKIADTSAEVRKVKQETWYESLPKGIKGGHFTLFYPLIASRAPKLRMGIYEAHTGLFPLA